LSYEDQTKAELQDELRSRELPTSGSKQELIDRLTEADEADETEEPEEAEETEEAEEAEEADDASRGGKRDGGGGRGGRKGPKPMQLAQLAARQLAQISGRDVNGVTGLERTEEGWRVSVDLVEIARIPPSTDIIGSYEVVVDDDGDLVRYERIRRYIRGQAGEDMA
jgi:hypothetical protein